MEIELHSLWLLTTKNNSSLIYPHRKFRTQNLPFPKIQVARPKITRLRYFQRRNKIVQCALRRKFLGIFHCLRRLRGTVMRRTGSRAPKLYVTSLPFLKKSGLTTTAQNDVNKKRRRKTGNQWLPYIHLILFYVCRT